MVNAGRFYVSGGRQRVGSDGPEWTIYEEATIALVDAFACSVTPIVSYASPPGVCPPDGGSLLFKAASRRADRYYVCTSTEIVVYQLPEFEQVGYITHPAFNDLHHVLATSSGTLLVANTGLDMVMEFTESGSAIREFGVTGDPPWTRFSRDVDYRLVPTTKPHGSHPNYVFESGGELWVTRGEQKDAVCLTGDQPPYAIGDFYPHDGVPFDGRVYFTRVDGKVLVFDERTRLLESVIDLRDISPRRDPLGWCRGLHVIDGDTLVVTFSRLRRTKFRETLQWLKWNAGIGATPRSEPARIAAFDINRRRVLWEIPLEPGLHAVFSVVPA